MKPYIVIHSVTSVNGSITGFVSDMALYNFVALIWKPDAMLTSSNTFLSWYQNKEDESEKEPIKNELQKNSDNAAKPVLVVADSGGKVDCWDKITASSFWKRIVVLCSESTPESYLEHLRKKDIGYMITGVQKVDLKEAVDRLQKEHNINVIRVDCGNILRNKLLEMELVDELSFLIHPNIVIQQTDVTNPDYENHSPVEQTDKLINLELIELKKVRKNIIWSRYKVKYT